MKDEADAVGLLILGTLQLAVGAYMMFMLAVAAAFASSGDQSLSVSADFVWLRMIALPTLFLVSGLGLFFRSRVFGLYPAIGSAALLIPLVLRFELDALALLLYSVILVCLLCTRYRTAFARKSP